MCPVASLGDGVQDVDYLEGDQRTAMRMMKIKKGHLGQNEGVGYF